jgi:hypothetical protein
MIDYSKFCLPRCSRNYAVSLNNLAAYAILTGMEDVAQRLSGHESEKAVAGSARDALSDVLRRYGVNGSLMESVMESVEGAGTESFVEDLGPNPPQRKKMIRYIANVHAAVRCGTNCGEEYHDTFRKLTRKFKKDFEGDGAGLIEKYYITVDAVRKLAEDKKITQDGGHTQA